MNIVLQKVDDEEAPLGVLEQLAGYHLRRASGAFGADFARAVEGTGMRQVLFGILSVVGANPGINQGAAGRSLGIQRANMVTLINQLADVGLLDRQTAADDRRALALSLTAAGETMLEECLARIEVHEEHMLAGLTAAERRTLIGLLTKIEGRKR
ncbi:MAG: MarR family transcriptional regulator [Sphingomonas sp.]